MNLLIRISRYRYTTLEVSTNSFLSSNLKFVLQPIIDHITDDFKKNFKNCKKFVAAMNLFAN